MSARTIKLTITYDGTRLVGWQRQAEGASAQGLIEEALARLNGGPVTVHGAGRTDAGVHALGQVASVQLTCAHPPEVLVRALNGVLPRDIRVIDACEVAPAFHARFSATSKTYRYLLRNGATVSPFERHYVWHVVEPLEIDAMQQAAAAVLGTHDFSAFQSSGATATTTVRTITRSEMTLGSPVPLVCPVEAVACGTGPVANSRLLVYEVSGTGFLRHMVRAIVGTLVEVGRGRRPSASMTRLLGGGDRSEAGATAPPHGLFLVRVDYD